jgi:DNA-binding transcriptional regulator YbjK
MQAKAFRSCAETFNRMADSADNFNKLWSDLSQSRAAELTGEARAYRACADMMEQLAKIYAGSEPKGNRNV